MAASASRFLTFRAGDRLQAIPADAVREVIKPSHITRVPNAPLGLTGVTNVRGTVLPVLSVAVLQGRQPSQEGRILILDQIHPIGLLVDQVHALVASRGRTTALDVDGLLGKALRKGPAIAAAIGARAHASPVKEDKGPATVLLSLVCARQEFALPLDQVAEVIAVPPAITYLPGNDSAVLGTIEHRGNLLPILVLSTLLGLDGRTARIPTRIVIVMLRGHRIGLAVEEIRSILRVDAHVIAPLPTIIARRAGEARIQAIARLDKGKRLVSILAVGHLFSETFLSGLGHKSEAQKDGVDDMMTDAAEPFLIFRLGDQSFGIPANAVSEVVRTPDTLTRIPRAPDFIEGVMNLRGRAIPVIDQRRRFGQEDRADRYRRAIVVTVGTLHAAFIVDEVTEVRDLSRASIAPAPDISHETRLFDRTALLDDGRIVLLIEPAELLDGAEREILLALRSDTASASP